MVNTSCEWDTADWLLTSGYSEPKDTILSSLGAPGNIQ